MAAVALLPTYHPTTSRSSTRWGEYNKYPPSQQCAGSHSMSKSHEERVDFAVSQLIERVVPVYPEDDEETSEQRLDEAYHFARELLGR
jgi:hypothetical protein